MKTNLTEIKDYLKGKSICLIGNARSILSYSKGEQIDNFDIVCRINKGIPTGKEEFIGKRTDVLFLATKFDENIVKKEYNPKFIVWTTECQKLALDWVQRDAIQNPPEDWRELRAKLPSLPSTGLVSFMFLLKHIEFKQLTIFGFDGFISYTWYNSLKNQSWHNGKLEETIILNYINSTSKDILWIKN